MTKISIDVDFNEDPQTILEQIQKKAKSEVEKREKKEQLTAHLKVLHEKVNEAVGTSYKNPNELIRALAAYATPVLRDRILGVTSTGRRKTITMTSSLLEKIGEDLKAGTKTKAQIARDHGVSATQVTKVQAGGYRSKFDAGSVAIDSGVDSSADQAELEIPDSKPKQEELSIPGPMSAPEPPVTSDEEGADGSPESEASHEGEASGEAGAEEPEPAEGDSFEELSIPSPIPSPPEPSEEVEEEPLSLGDAPEGLDDIPEEPSAPESSDAPEPPDPGLSIPSPEPSAPDLVAPAPPEPSAPDLVAPAPPEPPAPDLVAPAPPEPPALDLVAPASPEPPPSSDLDADTESVAPPIPEPIEVDGPAEQEAPATEASPASPEPQPPAPGLLPKPKPSIKLPGKKKGSIKLKGKLSSIVTRPPMGSTPPTDPSAEPPQE